MSQTIEIRLPSDQQEGTRSVLQTWLKKAGDRVKAHEPIAEMETDKVVVELAAPADGVLLTLHKQEGDEVESGELVAELAPSEAMAGVPVAGVADQATSTAPVAAARVEVAVAGGGAHSHKTSPAVRRLLREHGLSLGQLVGTGRHGRVTVRDIEAWLAMPADRPATAAAVAAPALSSHDIPHDTMRRRIAEHMQRSVQTAPHVTTVFEADLSAILAHKKRWGPELAARGKRLTLTAYFVAASALAMRQVPVVNSRWHEDRLEVFGNVNIGVGTALGDAGLVVPVLRDVQAMDLYQVAEGLESITGKARDGKLKPADMQGGTFTISNHGVSGSLIASPIVINQPQSAILGIGKLEKRVIVREVDGVDTIQIRPLCYVTLTLDHRVLDGFQANSFLTALVGVLENWPVDAGASLPA